MQHSELPSPAPATAEEAVMVAFTRIGKRLKQRLPGEELEFSSILLLKTLSNHGPMRVSALAGALGLDASTVSRHVKALEDRGVLERTSDPDDGRASRVMVSASGLTRLEQGAARRRALIGELLADWDDADRETLRRLLHRLSAQLDPQETP